MSAATDPLGALSRTLCANERQGALLEAIEEKLQVAINEMQPGEAREREFYSCWLLLLTAHENHDAIDKRFHDAEEAILATGLATAIRDHAGKAVAA